MKTEKQKMQDLNELATARGLNAKPLTTQTDKATERPWGATKNCIVTSPGMTICNCDFSSIQNDEAKQANTDLIVRAVNEHAALVAVAEAAKAELVSRLGDSESQSKWIEAWQHHPQVDLPLLRIHKTLANLAAVRGHKGRE